MREREMHTPRAARLKPALASVKPSTRVLTLYASNTATSRRRYNVDVLRKRKRGRGIMWYKKETRRAAENVKPQAEAARCDPAVPMAARRKTRSRQPVCEGVQQKTRRERRA